MEQSITFKAPIKIIPSENYYLVIEDAEGTRHYFHKEHENKYGKFIQGEYDGWSMKACEGKGWIGGKVKCDLCGHEWVAVYHIDSERLECPNCKNLAYVKSVKDE